MLVVVVKTEEVSNLLAEIMGVAAASNGALTTSIRGIEVIIVAD